MKLAELESKMNGGNGMLSPPANFATPASTLSGSDNMGQAVPGYPPPQEYPWQGVQNRFPAIAFLDSDSFKNGG